MSDGIPPVYYWGRLWNAPFTDDAKPMGLAKLAELLRADRKCDFCDEGFYPADDIYQLPHIVAHLECHLRAVLGDVAHLEGRCLCCVGVGNEVVYVADIYESYRASSKATLEWLISHRRGQFR